jgi:hypothetical protein
MPEIRKKENSKFFILPNNIPPKRLDILKRSCREKGFNVASDFG